LEVRTGANGWIRPAYCVQVLRPGGPIIRTGRLACLNSAAFAAEKLAVLSPESSGARSQKREGVVFPSGVGGGHPFRAAPD
jgi:hypothetical protein